MANDVAIRVRGLGKRYRLGERRGASRTLREAIMDLGRVPGRMLRRRANGDDTLWALKDVDLEVKRGEVLGVIGRNGAGKTTLLKILSRITEPTTGRVELHGRVGSLLEVGTGFHPELTGRENIYLNGAILGMKKVEIDRKFDEIVAFAEIERFLDTPVKHYSSGMYVRLAFAVAAHLEPEILLVDEVLAVGDLAFQQKCLGKMGEVAGAESTVLFVSHNLRAVRALCPRTLVLDEGRVAVIAPTPEALHVYLEQVRTSRVGPESAVHDPTHRRGSGAARLTVVRVEDPSGAECYDVATGGMLRFRCGYRTFRELPELLVAVGLRSGSTGELVTTVRHTIFPGPVAAGVTGEAVIEAGDIPVRPGEYPLYFWLGNSSAQPFDVVDDLTPPLLVHAPKDVRALDFEPTAPVGYFSMPSRLVDVQQDGPPRG